MMSRDDQPQDFEASQRVIVEALPKSTLVVAGAFYVVLAGLMAWVLLVAVDTAASVRVMATRLEFYARDMTAAEARANRTDLRLDAMEKRMYEERGQTR
jgi:hypothetical protein